MNYEKVLRDKIEMKMNEYYPSGNQIKRIKVVRERFPNFFIFKCDLEGGEQIFIKSFNKDILVERAEIWKRLSEHRDEVLMPKIFDIFEDMNAVVMEGIKGKKLSSMLVFESIPLLKTFYKNNLYLYMEEIGKAIGKLQTLTAEKSKKLRELRVISLNEFKLDPGLKKRIGNKVYNKINRKIDDIREEKMMVTRVHGEMLPHNIIVNRDKVHFIDFLYYEGFYFEDPICFSVALELTQRAPHFSYNLFNNLNERFIKAYKEFSPCEVDEELWEFFRLLRYCLILKGYEYWTKYTPIDYIIPVVDGLYLRKKIKQIVTEIGL